MAQIHLQGIGKHYAIMVCQLMVGDTLVWNYGAKSKVIAIDNLSKCYIKITTMDEKGNVYERRMKRDRLVAVIENNEPINKYSHKLFA